MFTLFFKGSKTKQAIIPVESILWSQWIYWVFWQSTSQTLQESADSKAATTRESWPSMEDSELLWWVSPSASPSQLRDFKDSQAPDAAGNQGGFASRWVESVGGGCWLLRWARGYQQSTGPQVVSCKQAQPIWSRWWVCLLVCLLDCVLQ